MYKELTLGGKWISQYIVSVVCIISAYEGHQLLKLNSRQYIFFLCSEVVPIHHGLTACFCLGNWRAEIYSPNPPFLPAPPCSLGRWSVPDVIMHID